MNMLDVEIVSGNNTGKIAFLLILKLKTNVQDFLMCLVDNNFLWD